MDTPIPPPLNRGSQARAQLPGDLRFPDRWAWSPPGSPVEERPQQGCGTTAQSQRLCRAWDGHPEAHARHRAGIQSYGMATGWASTELQDGHRVGTGRQASREANARHREGTGQAQGGHPQSYRMGIGWAQDGHRVGTGWAGIHRGPCRAQGGHPQSHGGAPGLAWGFRACQV